MAKPNYRHQKRQREAQRLTRQAEKLQKRQAAVRAETGETGDAVAGTPVPESTAADAITQKPAG